MKQYEKRILIIAIVISLLILMSMMIWIVFDKNNMYHINVNNPNLIKTKNGYKEVLVVETTIINKYIQKARFGPSYTKKSYNVQYYNEELKENVSIPVGKKQYNELNIGDRIKAIRTVTYTKGGFRLNYRDTAEKIE